MKKGRNGSAVLVALLILSAVSGCAPSGAAPESNPQAQQETTAEVEQQNQPAEDMAAGEETRIFTDSVGRQVELPADLQRIAPSGAVAQQALYSLAPDRMVGWSSQPTDSMKKYFDEKYTSLPTFGTFFGKSAALNVEALISAAPQAVIDFGEVKGDMREELDALQEQIGIPVVFIEATLETMGDAYRTLGGLLDLTEEAKPLADYCDSAVADAKEKAAAIPEESRVKVYYGEGGNGLETYPSGSSHVEAIDLVGGMNVADKDSMAASGGNAISMEQLLLWEPEVILFGPDRVFSAVGDDPLWKDLSAIQQRRYYEIPGEPFNWMDRPPAVNRMIGVKWLGNLLYPEQFQYDMVAEAKTFYQLFYHYELTDEEARALMANSTFLDTGSNE